MILGSSLSVFAGPPRGGDALARLAAKKTTTKKGKPD